MEIINKRKIICSNCREYGHEFRNCDKPITSYGLINIDIIDNYNELSYLKEKFSTKKNTYIKIESKKYNTKCYISNNIKLSTDHEDKNIFEINSQNIKIGLDNELQKFWYYKNKIIFMLASRKFSLGFIEFVRGKYNVVDANEIINLFEQMYECEIKLLSNNEYDDILYIFLNRKNESKEIVLNRIYESKYSNEYCEAKIKFNLLKYNETDTDIPWNLYFYTRNIKPKWSIPEWGFPKGRRDKFSEENINCACREFEEETGYDSNEYIVLNKIEPIEENLIGTNGINYKHVYYLAINNTIKDVSNYHYDTYEIGDLKWFTYEEAINNIRPYHYDKKNILTRVFLFIINNLINIY